METKIIIIWSLNIVKDLQFFLKRSEVTQSCPTLCDPMDYSFSVCGILQARTLE